MRQISGMHSSGAGNVEGIAGDRAELLAGLSAANLLWEECAQLEEAGTSSQRSAAGTRQGVAPTRFDGVLLSVQVCPRRP